MIIAQISDTHIALDAEDADQRIRDFERTIADINALTPAPDIIIHSGDIVHNGRADEYEKAAEILAGAVRPVYLMVGNKDDRTAVRAAFPTHTYLQDDADYITYEIPDLPVRIVVLDTLDPENNKGDFCTDRRRRFTRLMARNPHKPTAVFAHHPPILVDEGPEALHFGSPSIMQSFCDALLSSGTVIALFCGHVHRSVTGHVGPIPVSVATSNSTTLRWSDYPDHLKSCPVYHLHTYDPDYGFSTATKIVPAD